VSSLGNANVEGAADLIANRRVITATVLADDGGPVVLGGLITDDRLSQRDRVPGLGDAPVPGNLFRARNDQATSRPLVVFLRPPSCATARTSAPPPRPSPPRPILNEREIRRLPLEIEGLR
jgi:general secretion pathway protein D